MAADDGTRHQEELFNGRQFDQEAKQLQPGPSVSQVALAFFVSY